MTEREREREREREGKGRGRVIFIDTPVPQDVVPRLVYRVTSYVYW